MFTRIPYHPWPMQPIDIRFETLFKRFTRIMRLIAAEEELFATIYPEEAAEFGPLAKELQLMIVENPGLIVNMGDISPQLFKSLLKVLWDLDGGDLFLESYSGSNLDFGMNMVNDYMERMKHLRPIQVHLDPKDLNFRTHFQEAFNCYAHGLHTSCLIMIASVLESALRSKLIELDESYQYRLHPRIDPIEVKPNSLGHLIELAYEEKLINQMNQGKAFQITNLRNDAIHKSKVITDEESIHAIKESIRIVEHLYQDKSQ